MVARSRRGTRGIKMAKQTSIDSTFTATVNSLAQAVASHPRVTDKSRRGVASKVAQRLNRQGVACHIPGSPGYWTGDLVIAACGDEYTFGL